MSGAEQEHGPHRHDRYVPETPDEVVTIAFFKNLQIHLPEKAKGSPVFDGRAWTVPSKEEAANVLLWREMDATRNSIQMAAYAKFSHKQLMNKNTKQMQEMLFQAHGINWNDYPDRFKRGTFIRRTTVTRKLRPEERERIAERHRPAEDAEVTRTEIVSYTLPPLLKIANRVEVIFEGAHPELRKIDERVAPEEEVKEQEDRGAASEGRTSPRSSG